MMEATCSKCYELFIPNDENDLIHAETYLGEKCGGQGLVDLRTISDRVDVIKLHMRGVVLGCVQCKEDRHTGIAYK